MALSFFTKIPTKLIQRPNKLLNYLARVNVTASHLYRHMTNDPMITINTNRLAPMTPIIHIRPHGLLEATKKEKKTGKQTLITKSRARSLTRHRLSTQHTAGFTWEEETGKRLRGWQEWRNKGKRVIRQQTFARTRLDDLVFAVVLFGVHTLPFGIGFPGAKSLVCAEALDQIVADADTGATLYAVAVLVQISEV